MAIQTISYIDEHGNHAEKSWIDPKGAYQLTGQRERFAQLVAEGMRISAAYVAAFGSPFATDEERKAVYEMASHLAADTSIVLRVQELRKPVLRKIRRKIEYGLQKALEQCETAFDLAYAQGDAKALLKAVEMQSRLAKLLSE